MMGGERLRDWEEITPHLTSATTPAGLLTEEVREYLSSHRGREAREKCYSDLALIASANGFEAAFTRAFEAFYAEIKTEQAAPAGKPTVRPGDYSDTGNAAMFVREYKDDVIYTDSMGWLCWDGKRWEANEHRALALATELTDRMLEEAKTSLELAYMKKAEAETNKTVMGDGTELAKAKEAVATAEAYYKHAKATRKAARTKAILEMAIPSLVRKGTEMDANPSDLNTPAGIINLTTGAWRLNEREALCTKITEAARGSGGAEEWQQFLEVITCGDLELQEFLQTVAGMALYGKVYQEGAIFAIGDGSNGKSTFFNALAAVMGDYAGTIDIDTLTTSGGNKGNSYATMRGKRLIVAGEMEEGRRLSASVLKKITSTDQITAEEKYRQPESFTPSHTLCLFTNHLPRVGSTDPGTWRRIFLVPFSAKIERDDAKQNYGEYLVEHAGQAILSWAIEGAVMFARNRYKLNPPAAVKEATSAYRARENWLENFVAECCVRGSSYTVGARSLYTAYKDWSESTREYTRRENEFSQEMEKAGFVKVMLHGARTYKGVRLAYSPGYSTPASHETPVEDDYNIPL